MDVNEMFEQLRSCGYECEAGPLENNITFLALVRIARNFERLGCPNYGPKENGTLGPCYRDNCPWCSEFAS